MKYYSKRCLQTIITPVIGFIINPALGVHHSKLPGESVIKECYGIIIANYKL